MNPKTVPAPKAPGRGVYLNIASPVAGLTVHDWTETRWEAFLENIRTAGADTLYVYLWQDILSDFEGAPERKSENRALHARLRDVIRRAKRHGLRTVFLMAPTFVPRPIFDRHPELRATIEYVDHGFSCVCPSHPQTLPLLERYVAHEWEWFRDADALQLWFYDPGGCVCAKCTADLCAPLLRQVELAERVVRRHSPKAALEISFWPVWAWERILKRPFGEELLDRLKSHFGQRSREVTIVDSAEGDEAFLEEAKARGFRTQAFLFSANVETPFVFFHPLPSYFESMARRVREKGVDGAFVHLLNPGAKELNTLIGLKVLGERPGKATDTALRDACRIYLRDRRAADRFAKLLPRWEALLAAGKPAPAAIQSLLAEIETALSTAPAAIADTLLSSLRAVHVLASPPDPLQQTRLQTVLENSPTFRGFAPQAVAELPRLRQFVDDGWNKMHF